MDSTVEITGLKRKACIKRFRRLQKKDSAHVETRGRPRYYTPDCIAALKEVWEIGSEACGENLHSQIGEYIDTQIREGSWKHDESDFIEEKTVEEFVTGRNKCYYTHKKVRSAYLSLKTNLPHLFTHLKYPELNIPNTTNSLDGSFSPLKKKLAAHHGLRKDRRYKVISELLKGAR
mgnify:FL=1